MDVNVKLIPGDDLDELYALHEWCQQIVVPEWQCAPGAPYPRWDELCNYATHHRAYVTKVDGQFATMALTTKEGKIFWFITDPRYFAETFRRLRDRIIADCGDITGTVTNPLMRRQFVEHGDAEVFNELEVSMGPELRELHGKP